VGCLGTSAASLALCFARLGWFRQDSSPGATWWDETIIREVPYVAKDLSAPYRDVQSKCTEGWR
jgi:hypothetical protein